MEFTLNLDSFVSHKLPYLFHNFGVKRPFGMMQKIKVKVGILIILQKSDVSYINGKLPS
jgi:hypothetical protein